MDVKQNNNNNNKKKLASELRGCVKVEVDVLGSPSLIVRSVSVDVKQNKEKKKLALELKSCVKLKVEVAVLASRS